MIRSMPFDSTTCQPSIDSIGAETNRSSVGAFRKLRRIKRRLLLEAVQDSAPLQRQTSATLSRTRTHLRCLNQENDHCNHEEEDNEDNENSPSRRSSMSSESAASR